MPGPTYITYVKYACKCFYTYVYYISVYNTYITCCKTYVLIPGPQKNLASDSWVEATAESAHQSRKESGTNQENVSI